MVLAELIDHWQARRDELDTLGAQVTAAALFDEILADIRLLLQGQGEELLNLTQAAEVSGYTADHLGRLVRSGTIPNQARFRAPKIRRADVPIRPGRIANGPAKAYDPLADARKLGSRQKGGP